MATFKICVFKHQQRKDGLFPVSIRVTWKSLSAYIKTQYHVSKKQITVDYTLKDPFILRELNNRIARYEEMKVLKLRQNINNYSAKELADYFVRHSEDNTGASLDFIKFAKEVSGNTRNIGTSKMYKTVINSLKEFYKSEVILTTSIRLRFLQAYEAWLVEKGLTPTGINLYLRTFRALFNKMKDAFNDEEAGDIPIPQNPFKKFKMPTPVVSKGVKAITIEQIRKIRDAEFSFYRDKLARDVFMLSLYLGGINTVDMYNATNYRDGRITYNRTKTRTRRQDQAIFSVRVEPEAEELLKIYRGKDRVFRFYEMYCGAQTFNQNINIGLRRMREPLNIPNLTFYSARSSFASIARNECGYSTEDVAKCLNHVSAYKVTDDYIKPDWSIVDRVLRSVLDVISEVKPQPRLRLVRSSPTTKSYVS